MVRNVLREFRATDGVTGFDWYYRALEMAHDMTGPHVSLAQAVGVIAALSPQTQWWQNVMLARQVISAGAMVQGHTGDTMRKVNAILSGTAPLDALGGLKVRSFYQNILDGGMGDGVTIDRHAWRTAMGRNELGKRNAVPTDRAYRAAAEAFERAAEIVGNYTPAQLQAIVWVPRAA
jgi:hypothetical protein